MKTLLILIVIVLASCGKQTLAPEPIEEKIDSRVCYEETQCTIIEQYLKTSKVECGAQKSIIENVYLSEPHFCW